MHIAGCFTLHIDLSLFFSNGVFNQALIFLCREIYILHVTTGVDPLSRSHLDEHCAQPNMHTHIWRDRDIFLN